MSDGEGSEDVGRLNVDVDVLPQYEDQVDVDLLGRAVRAALTSAGSSIQSAEASVVVTDDDTIHELNRTYRDVDKPTDVLSFSFIEEDSGPAVQMPPDWPQPLGEIVLSFPYVKRQAEDLGHSIEMELSWLAIHGALQLLGFTHYNEEDAARMEALERNALEILGFSLDPR